MTRCFIGEVSLIGSFMRGLPLATKQKILNSQGDNDLILDSSLSLVSILMASCCAISASM